MLFPDPPFPEVLAKPQAKESTAEGDVRAAWQAGGVTGVQGDTCLHCEEGDRAEVGLTHLQSVFPQAVVIFTVQSLPRPAASPWNLQILTSHPRPPEPDPLGWTQRPVCLPAARDSEAREV